jgi:hypothetical protein
LKVDLSNYAQDETFRDRPSPLLELWHQALDFYH